MKLNAPIPSNSVKLIELYNKISSESLILGPNFQRKLVWKKQHKYAFIETILLNFPFPEIYIASTEMDTKELKTKEVVVDGQQRLSAIVDYIHQRGDFVDQKKVTPFDDLDILEKKEFLNYLITVKDLKDIGDDNIKEVFKRINSTNYSLNLNEVLNAEYGGGEFAIFCKLLSDKEYNFNELETGITIDESTRNEVIEFFIGNKVFTDNDVKRMFDSQYIMLLVSTILEGDYFGRATKINNYLQKYNEEFSSAPVLNKILNSIRIIKKLKFSDKSYWFNKANLFTLIIELQDVDEKKLDLDILELKLLDLENKVDIYYNSDEEEEIKKLTSDETKYFEVARQGSHEGAARQHRGNVVKKFIEDSYNKEVIKGEDKIELKNLNFLKQKGIQYAVIIPTETGLKKSIMDAVSGVREFLKENDIHDYDAQDLGPDHKKKMDFVFKGKRNEMKSELSLYRSNGRGDYRIWFSSLSKFAKPNEELALTYENGVLTVLNISKFDYTEIENNK